MHFSDNNEESQDDACESNSQDGEYFTSFIESLRKTNNQLETCLQAYPDLKPLTLVVLLLCSTPPPHDFREEPQLTQSLCR